MGRTVATEIIARFDTKSDQIRALAKAGYLRTEIAELLGIRYQHVRKVLTDAGIRDGLRNQVFVARSAVVIETKEHPKNISSQFLISAGFSLLGEWKKLSEAEFELDARAPREPGVYAFALDDVIVYVGITQTGLRTRLDHYKRGHVRQKTSARVKRLIARELNEGKSVKVLTAVPPASEWNGLPVNTAAGLETGLIQLIQPQWNIQGKTNNTV
jgi:hypothetical protein